jgi:hypothetical protein
MNVIAKLGVESVTLERVLLPLLSLSECHTTTHSMTTLDTTSASYFSWLMTYLCVTIGMWLRIYLEIGWHVPRY